MRTQTHWDSPTGSNHHPLTRESWWCSLYCRQTRRKGWCWLLCERPSAWLFRGLWCRRSYQSHRGSSQNWNTQTGTWVNDAGNNEPSVWRGFAIYCTQLRQKFQVSERGTSTSVDLAVKRELYGSETAVRWGRGSNPVWALVGKEKVLITTQKPACQSAPAGLSRSWGRAAVRTQEAFGSENPKPCVQKQKNFWRENLMSKQEVKSYFPLCSRSTNQV